MIHFVHFYVAYDEFQQQEYKRKITDIKNDDCFILVSLPKLLKKFAFLNNKIPTKSEQYGILNPLSRLASPVISVIEQS